MTLSNLKTILENISGFENKVTYRAFPVSKAPKLPYICYLETNTANFNADSQVYKKRQYVDIELYTKLKSPSVEELVETALNENKLIWEKYEEFIESEDMYQITYEVVI